MFVQVGVDSLIDDYGVLLPKAKELLAMFGNIYAKDTDLGEEWDLLQDEGDDTQLEIYYGEGGKSSSAQVELALSKAGIKLPETNPFHDPAYVAKRRKEREAWRKEFAKERKKIAASLSRKNRKSKSKKRKAVAA